MESLHRPDQVRERLRKDVADGKTVVLSSKELEDPSLREQLPQFLEDLTRAHPPASRVGPALPGYTVLGEIGQGGMSTVYLARQEKLGRHVAIKIAPAWLGGGERARRMLVQEARAMARLTHPNIVVIHDIIDAADTFAIAMEWVDGRTLSSLMRALPPTPGPDDVALFAEALGTPPEAREAFEPTIVRHFVHLVRDVALAAQTVHEAELLHLDIKPSNVLVRRDGTPLLADFGVTREITPQGEYTRTFAGTPVYAAPEQLRRDDARIGPATDVYGLGMTLYEVLARSQPLGGLDLPSIVKSVESGSMPRLSQKIAVPPDLENIVHKAIAPEPEHRYRTAQAFADDLQAFLDDRPVQARPLTAAERLRRWMRNEPWKAALAASLAVLIPALIGLGTYLVLQLPAIFEAERASRQEQANRDMQEAFQRFLTYRGSLDYCIEPLERALELDPGRTSLACLLALTAEKGWPHVDEVCERHRDAIEQEPSLRMMRGKFAARRCFFDDDEVARLRQSDDHLDRYVLALDRFLHARDERSRANLRESSRALEAAALSGTPDPLLLGLLLWNAAHREDMDRFGAVMGTMWERWPDDPVVLTWSALALEPIDNARAVTIADRVIASMPDLEHGYVVLAAGRARANDPDGCAKVLERARAAGVPTEEVERLVSLARARLTTDDGAADEAAVRDLLDRYPPDRLPQALHLRLLNRVDKAAARERARELAHHEHPTPRMLEAAANYSLDDPDLMRTAIERYFELYPDRRNLHTRRIALAWFFERGNPREAMRKISDLAREITLVGDELKVHITWIVRANMFTGAWDELKRHASAWRESKGAPAEAWYYEAVGSARLGELEQAHGLLERALAVEKQELDGSEKRVPSWYVEGLLESAWLRCSPRSEEILRDARMAALRLEAFEKHNPDLDRPHGGPWTQLVRAEVKWANGDQEGAREALRSAIGARRPEPPAPRDFAEYVEEAAERMGVR